MNDLSLNSKFVSNSNEAIMPDDGDATHIITFFPSEGYAHIACVRGEMVEFSLVESLGKVTFMILREYILHKLIFCDHSLHHNILAKIE